MTRLALALLAFLLVAAAGLAQGKIAVGDRLAITVTNNKELTGAYSVAADGTISMPFIGVVQVKDLTPAEAAQKITKILREQRIVLEPQVTVSMPGKARTTVLVSGAVTKPGEYQADASTTLDALLKQAQPSSNADLGAVRITAPDGSVSVVDYSSFRLRPDSGGNPKVLPGSEIYVTIQPELDDITVLGAVVKPGVVTWTQGLTLSQAIQAAGSAKADGDIKRIELKRRGGEVQIVSLAEVGGNLVLLAGDQVYVPVTAGASYVLVRGAVRNPGLIPFRDGMTLSSTIGFAGGPLDSARMEKLEIKRVVGGDTETIKASGPEIQGGKQADPLVRAGDTINVPYRNRGPSTGEIINYAWLALSLILIFKR